MSETGGQAPPAGGDPWYAAADDETKGFFQNRGLDRKTAAEAAMELTKSYREAASKLGIPPDRVLRLPEATDAAGMKALRQKLGAPEKPEEYDFTGLTIDEPLANVLRAIGAEAGIAKDQAAAIAAAISKHQQDAKTAAEVESGTALAAAWQSIEADWGMNKDANRSIVNRTLGVLGKDAEFINSLPADRIAPVVGLLLQIGLSAGEPTSLTGAGGNGAGNPRVMTLEQATLRLAELGQDKAWYQKFNNPSDPGHQAAKQEWDYLNRLMASRVG